ncbi:hypothetical protein [Metapseudomonas otitidis]|uniref:hypothetical protein n=2 Tax=Metapseudomonas otitidis TaxID=319939 RepID=UPI0013F6765B|nr:hypothetical protein [Pseudomonas otitidis]
MKPQKFLITTLAIILLGCEKPNTHTKFEKFKENSETEITYTPASQSNYYLALAFPSQQNSRTSYSNDFSCTDQELEIEIITGNSKSTKTITFPTMDGSGGWDFGTGTEVVYFKKIMDIAMTKQPYKIKAKILKTGSCPTPNRAYLILTRLTPKV